MPSGSFEVDRNTHVWESKSEHITTGLVEANDRYRSSGTSGPPLWFYVTPAMVGLDVVNDSAALLALDCNVVIRRTES